MQICVSFCESDHDAIHCLYLIPSICQSCLEIFSSLFVSFFSRLDLPLVFVLLALSLPFVEQHMVRKNLSTSLGLPAATERGGPFNAST